MIRFASRWRVILFVSVTACGLALAAAGSRVQATDAPSCCQCANAPLCGPPRNGQCGAGCTLITNATCDGRSGRCQAVSSFEWRPMESQGVLLTSASVSAARTRPEALGGSR